MSNAGVEKTPMLQDNAVKEESTTFVPAEYVEESVGTPAAYVEEIPTLQDNAVEEESTTFVPAEYVEESAGTPAAYVEEIPTMQDNAVEEESTTFVPAEYVEEVALPAAAYTEEVPALQGNSAKEEDAATTPIIPADESEATDVRPRTDIIGSVAVSGDVTIGGGARVGDDTLFKRNVTVEGWLEANNIKGALQQRLDLIEDIAKDAKDTADDGTITVKVLTDKGNVLHNGEGQRELTAYVYFRGEEVADRIYGGRFSWTRTSHDTTGDRIWNRLHEGIGRKCTITDEDVDRNAVFSCEVDLVGTWLESEMEGEN